MIEKKLRPSTKFSVLLYLLAWFAGTVIFDIWYGRPVLVSNVTFQVMALAMLFRIHMTQWERIDEYERASK